MSLGEVAIVAIALAIPLAIGITLKFRGLLHVRYADQKRGFEFQVRPNDEAAATDQLRIRHAASQLEDERKPSS